MLKKTTLAVIGLAASSFASAGTMGPVCTPGDVTVPCEAKRWDIGLQALYLQTNYSGDRSYRLATPTTFRELDNDWGWGYRAEGSYHFNTGNDVTVNWTHFSSNELVGGYSGIFLPFGITGTYSVINQNRFDQVNVVMGQHADFGLVKKMRFYAGMQYANIQTTATNYYPLVIPGVATSTSLADDTDFKGIGPVVGIDYSYDLTSGLSLVANGAGSILYGNARSVSSYIVAPTNAILASISGSKKAIIPSLEAKLGLNYGYAMPQGVLNIEGGYQVINYFDVLQTRSLQLTTSPVTGSDFGLYGPYLGLKYVGNV
ncbi:MAG TPA: Lpg1974 family pore-forming outer membrane protein [Legionella sp.]|nr:Lpg1974 family pore-forming outer membrane protein [Legionella sp.]